MRATVLRHKRIIYCGKIVGVLLALFCSLQSVAQIDVPSNLPNYDKKRIHYGFVLGFRRQDLKLKYDEVFTSPAFDSLQSVTPVKKGGLVIGFLVRYKLLPYLDARITPQVVLGEIALNYRFTDGTQMEELVERTTIEFPIMFKYMSQRRGNIRMFLVGGVSPSIDVTGKNEEISDSDKLLLVRKDVTLEFGFGLDLYFPLFKFSPEIRYSKGLMNLRDPKTNRFNEPIEQLTSNAISFYFIFN